MSDLRFEFGENWQKFARSATNTQVEEATAALARTLRLPSLERLTILGAARGYFETLGALSRLNHGKDLWRQRRSDSERGMESETSFSAAVRLDPSSQRRPE